MPLPVVRFRALSSETPPAPPDKRPYVLSISPSPFTRTALVRFFAPVSGKVYLRTYGLDGKLVDSQTKDVRLAEAASFRLDGTKLPSGTYVVQLVTDSGVFAQKTAVLK
uniref:T9SS type A sorting domain-containing protein n=1 Tax=candidate division WOR-3 bacterium TaxID=2052148 RepID=A0A7C4GDS2_UNCW3